MRKLLAVLFALAMCFSAVTTVLAAEPDARPDTRPEATNPQVKHNDEYGFAYTEVISSDHTIYRSYQKESVLTGDVPQLTSAGSQKTDEISQSPEKTKAILRSLGMGQEFIDMLSDKDLAEYARCKSIMGITVYTKTDAEGNVVNISEEEATSNAGARSLPEYDLVDPIPGPSGSYSNTYEDANMSLYYQVIYFGNGRYRFSVDATWLSPPAFRMTDSIGACAQNIAVEHGSAEGWYRCTVKEYSILGIDEWQHVYRFTDSDMDEAGANGWDGSAAKFNLYHDYEDDSLVPDTHAWDHMAHYQFYGNVCYPGLEMFFNTTATYSHMRTILNFEPSISLSVSALGGADASVSIGLGISEDFVNWNVVFPEPIHYEVD